MSVRLPEKIKIVPCREHHFGSKDKQLKFCATCGLSAAEYIKYRDMKRQADNNPEAFEEWVVKAYNEKLECKEHKHKIKDSGE